MTRRRVALIVGAVVASLISTARSLGVRCVAEGVETPEQLAVLQELDCDLAQGYLFSRPRPGCEGLPAALSPGDSGTFRGRSFTIEGRLVLQHPQGGTWEEYYAVFDGRNNAWISEAQGFWQVVTEVQVQAPPLQSLHPQMQVPFGQIGRASCRERV